MRVISQTELDKIIENHRHWLHENCDNWENMKADLSGTNLSGAYLRNADLRNADLSGAYLRNADLRNADLSGAYLRNADLRNADLRNAYLRNADLRNADLSDADLRNADLSGANLSGANLRNADLSGANGILSAIDFLKKHFEFTENGIIAYKTFSGSYNPPENWVLQSGSILTENVNPCRTYDCGCGINVAPIDWVRNNYNGDIWKVLIRWKWLAGVVVPYNSDGKIRCEKVELIEIVESN